MRTENRRYMLVISGFVIAFLSLILFLTYFDTFKSETLATDPNNPRLYIDEQVYQRGNIYNRQKEMIAYSEYEDSKAKRIFPYAEVDAPITGYQSTTLGQTGLEKSYNKELLGLDTEDKNDNKKIGYDIYTTLDQRMQNIVYDELKDKTASMVISDPKTGEVLAMVSTPTFDPNNLEENWDDLIQAENGEMMNRATQGTYRPGSSMKIVTTAGILENNLNEFYNDTGSEYIKNFRIRNFGYYHYGQVDLADALRYSINTYFANKTMAMGYDGYKAITDRFMFNQKYKFDLEKAQNVIPYSEIYDADLAMTGFGYGKTQTNPLHMSMIAGSVANKGKMMQPYLVSSVVDKAGTVIKETKPEVLSSTMSETNAEYLKELLSYTVEEGFDNSIKGQNIAGKTGTVENNKGTNEVWFVGMYPVSNPKYAFALVVENTSFTGSEVASPLAGKILRRIENEK